MLKIEFYKKLFQIRVKKVKIKPYTGGRRQSKASRRRSSRHCQNKKKQTRHYRRPYFI